MSYEIKDLERTKDGKLPAVAWPGLYPMVYITERGLIVCPHCANTETSDPVTHYNVNYEDENLCCDDCGKKIESAYGGES